MSTCSINVIQPCAANISDTEFMLAAKLLQHPKIIWCTGDRKVGKTIWALKTASILLQHFEHYVNPMFFSFSSSEINHSTHSYWKKLINSADQATANDSIQENTKGIYEMNFASAIKLAKDGPEDKKNRFYDFLIDKLFRFIIDAKTNFIIIDGIEKYIDPDDKDLQQRFIKRLTSFLNAYGPSVTIIITADYHCFLPTQMPLAVTKWDIHRPAFLDGDIKEFGDTYLIVEELNDLYE